MVKTALITGANGGIGQALCCAFKEAGYFVIGSDRVVGACQCDVFIKSDVLEICTNQQYRVEFFEKVRWYLDDRGLSVLLNNAAIQILNKTEDITLQDWHQTLDTNLIAPFLLVQGLLSDLEKANGSVVNIASVHATATKPGFICYATSKAALVGLTKTMAVDLGPRVRVNAICPGATATPMLIAGFEGKEESFKQLSKMHPLERIAEPEEVAQVALFLASPQASFITGASLSVDGGISSRLHDPV